jgi:HPt (histidine-containing phosphotransfer) domain-containing protein
MNFKELAESLGLDEEEYLEIFGLFVETGRTDLETIQSAIEEMNASEVERAAHSFKGASGNIGLMDLYEIAAEIVQKARNNQLEGIGERVESLRNKFEEIAKLALKD